MSSGIIIFARFDSTRLPGKSLLDIGGRPLLSRVIERALRVEGATVVVATSARPVDDAIARQAEADGVHVHRGEPEDVAARALGCARQFGFDYFARVCGDRPFFDPELVRTYLGEAIATGADLVTNAVPKTYPPGLTTEIVRTAALERVLGRTQEPMDREHVTRYLYEHSSDFRISSHQAPENWLDVSLVVDTQSDLDRARSIVARLGREPASASVADIVACARDWYRREQSAVVGGDA